MNKLIAAITITLGITLASLGAACTPDRAGDDRPPPPPTPSEAAALANLDRSLITCTTDDGCPRGAHCALAACAYECAADTDCVHGLTCDPQGRCR